MATGGDKTVTYELELPVAVTVKGTALSGEAMKSLHKKIKEEEVDLRLQIQKKLNIPFVNITRISLKNNKLILAVLFTSKTQVEDFYKVTKATKKGKQVNKMSKSFTECGEQFGLIYSVSVPYKDKLLFDITMSTTHYFKAMLAFAADSSDADDDDGEAEGRDEYSDNTVPSRVPEEDALKGPNDGSATDKRSSEGEEMKHTKSDEVLENAEDLHSPLGPNGKSSVNKDEQGPHLQKPTKADVQTRPPVEHYLMVRKEIVFFIPVGKGSYVHSVQIVSDGLDINQAMKERNGLWTAILHIEADKIAKINLLCFNCIVVEPGRVYGYKRKEYQYPKVPLTNVDPQREIWLGWEQEGVYYHLSDIIQSAQGKDIKDSVMEVESLNKFKIYPQEFNNMMQLLINQMSMSYDKHVLLFLATCGVLSCPDDLSSSDIARNLIAEMLHTLTSKCKLSDLPDSCNRYIPTVCQVFCQSFYKSDMCFVTFIAAVYPFLSAKFFNKRIEKAVSNNFAGELTICKSTDLCSKKAVELCTSLFKTGTSEHKDDADELALLCRTGRHLSLQILVDVYQNLQGIVVGGCLSLEKSTALQTLLSTLKSTSVRDARKARETSVHELLKVWQLLDGIEDLWNMCGEIVIKELLLLLSSTTSPVDMKAETAFETMCISPGLRNNAEAKIQILEKLACSDNKRLHGLFLKLLQSKEYENVASCVEANLFCKWFEFAKRHIQDRVYKRTAADELPSLYAYLCQVLCLPVVFDSDQIQNELKAAMYKHLASMDIKEVLQQSDKIDAATPSLCQTTASELFCMHIQQLLRKKYGPKPEDALLVLCGTRGVLRINTRTTASIACAIIDVQEVDCKEDTYAAVETICGKVKFWNKILAPEGTKCSLIDGNQTVQHVRLCVKEFVGMLEKEDVKCGFLERLSENKDDDQMLTLLSSTGFRKTQIRHWWKEAENGLKNEIKQISVMQTVLNTVKEVLTDHSCLPEGFDSVGQRLSEIELKRHSTTMTSRGLKKSKQEWRCLQSLPDYCKALENFVASKVFWNVCFKNDVFKDCSYFESSQHGIDYENDEILQSIRNLFHTDQDNNEDIESFNVGPTIAHLEALVKKGIDMYRSAWLTLQDDGSILFTDVLDFVRGVCIEDEINFAEELHRIPVHTCAKETLTRLFAIHEYKNRVDAMVSALETFGMTENKNASSFWDSVLSFLSIENEDTSDYTFGEIKEALETICGVADQLKEEDVAIMQMIGRSSQLVAFIREVVNEDIRNLIDAVEEVSEQHVSESTVSSLIDVKSFLQPLLKYSFESDDRETTFIKLLCQQSRSFPIGISAKMEDCMDNLHNLKSLYNNVANRGERTREIVANILKKSSVHFHLTETQRVDFWISYKQSKKTTVKHTKQALVDMRSRALLLMNTETRGKGAGSDDMDVFVKCIDLCMDIEEICFELYASGHVDYTQLDLSEEPNTLPELKERVFNDLEIWIDVLQNCRKTHYLMHFAYGSQIHALNDFLTKGKDVENVLPILTFINRLVTIDTMKDVVKEFRLNVDETYEKCLDEMGKFLHQVCDMQESCKRTLKFSDDESQVGSFVQEGKLFVAGLKKNSSLVVSTLLSIYSNTVGEIPEPNQVLFCHRKTTRAEICLSVLCGWTDIRACCSSLGSLFFLF